MASLGLWTLPFCSLARISPTFCSVASLPIESRPCFPRMTSQRSGSPSPSSGDHYNSEKAWASCWSPRTWHMDGNFGLRAEDDAPRSLAPRDSGRPIRVRTRREVRLAGPALRQLLCNPAEELIRASTTRPARSALSQHTVTLPASRFASHSIAPQAASASPGTASAPSLVLPTSSELCPRAYVRESNPSVKARLSGPALCQLLSNPAKEPTQVSTTRHVRSGPLQLVVLLPASCSAYD